MNAFVDENDRGWKRIVRSTSTTSTNDTRTTAEEQHLQIRVDGMVWSMVGRRRSTRVALLRLQLYHDDDCGGCEQRNVPRRSRVRTMTMVTPHHRYGNEDLLMYLWMKMLVARSELVGTVPVPARPLPQPRRLQYCGGGGGCRRC